MCPRACRLIGGSLQELDDLFWLHQRREVVDEYLSAFRGISRPSFELHDRGI